jgi:hypothetical protein
VQLPCAGVVSAAESGITLGEDCPLDFLTEILLWTACDIEVGVFLATWHCE